MTKKRKVPRPDWRYLARRMESVEVVSCADGTFRVTPKWDRKWAFQPEHLERPIPGLFTRMGSAEELQRLLNQRLRQEK